MDFFTEYRARRLRAEDIDRYVADWHTAPPGSEAAKVDLHEYLGLTWEQYGRWVTTGQLPEV